MGRSGNFARGLARAEPRDTFQTGHPGVTTMWTAVASLGLEWTGAFAGGQREVARRDVLQQPDLLLALAQARRGTGLLTGLVVLGTGLLSWRLFGFLPGLLAGGLLALDPFFLAHSRLLHLDAQLASWMTLAVLAALVAWRADGNWGYVVLSGVATGLALLTKTPAGFLLGFIPLAALICRGHGAARRLGFWRALGLWLAAAVVTFGVLWPAMWVAPDDTLARVLRFLRENSDEPVTVGRLEQEWAGADATFYGLVFLFRSTPFTLGGLAAAFLVTVLARRPDGVGWGRSIAVLALYAILFGLGMTLADKKLDRYLLPIFPALAILAGLGWAMLARALSARAGLPLGVGVVALLALQAWAALSSAPYYLTYFNPLLGGAQRGVSLIAVDWGEGLDQVADYLNAHADADRLRVGVPDEIHAAVLAAQTRSQVELADGADPGVYDYLVLYRRNLQRGRRPPFFDERFQQWTPEWVVRLHGVEYAWVYDTSRGAPLGAHFAEGLILEGYGLGAEVIRAGQQLPVALYWREAGAEDPHAGVGRQAEVHLVGPDGQTVAHAVGPLAGTDEAGVDHIRVVVPRGLAPGSYEIRCRVLDADGRPLDLRGPPTAQAAGRPEDTGWVALRSIFVERERR